MAKRMTVQEIERFVEKLYSTERVDDYIASQKINAIACLNNICRDLDYYGKKSLRIKENT